MRPTPAVQLAGRGCSRGACSCRRCDPVFVVVIIPRGMQQLPVQALQFGSRTIYPVQRSARVCSQAQETPVGVLCHQVCTTPGPYTAYGWAPPSCAAPAVGLLWGEQQDKCPLW